MTRATSGPNGSVSSEPVDLPLFSESKSPQLESSALLVRVRICRLCKIEKPYSEFYVNSKGNRRWGCKDCDRASERTRKRRDPAVTSARQKAWRMQFRGYALVNVARHRARKRGFPCDLDPADIQARITAGSCELTGIPFDLSKPRAWNAPSLDRINSTLGYTRENTRVVLFALNVMANTWGPNRILEIAAAIATRRKEASNTLSDKIAERLRASLPSGSTLFQQTWKRKVTPSGRVYWAHTASGRRTSGSECGSWPTARAQDSYERSNRKTIERAVNGEAQMTLSRAAKGYLAPWPTPRTPTGGPEPDGATGRRLESVASWATPTTRDHKDGGSMGTAQTNALFGRQVWLTGWPTPCQQDGPKGGPGQGADRLPAAAALSGWPTPKVATGDYQYSSGDHSKPVLNLSGAAKLTGWPTPNVADDNNSRASDPVAYSRKRMEGGYSNLATTAQAQVPGPTSSGSPAETGKPGQLNPRFSLWLMGYPKAWAECAQRVLRPSRRK